MVQGNEEARPEQEARGLKFTVWRRISFGGPIQGDPLPRTREAFLIWGCCWDDWMLETYSRCAGAVAETLVGQQALLSES